MGEERTQAIQISKMLITSMKTETVNKQKLFYLNYP